MKCNHDKNVRSLANETLGSTLTGRAMRFAAVLCNKGCVDMMMKSVEKRDFQCKGLRFRVGGQAGPSGRRSVGWKWKVCMNVRLLIGQSAGIDHVIFLTPALFVLCVLRTYNDIASSVYLPAHCSVSVAPHHPYFRTSGTYLHSNTQQQDVEYQGSNCTRCSSTHDTACNLRSTSTCTARRRHVYISMAHSKQHPEASLHWLL